ncbi:hypothetical protein N7U49_47975 (plasmid) [Streptomyces sp. AD2-2]|nr:hypothetical protein N7U49_47975 [Streptomyces sp. AD2-2]
MLDPHKPGNRPWHNGSSKNPPTGVSPWKNKPTNNTPVTTPASPKGTGTGGAQPGKQKGNPGPGANKGGRSPASTTIDPHKPGNRPWKNRPNTSVSNGPGPGAKPGGSTNGAPPKVNLSKGSTVPGSGPPPKANLSKGQNNGPSGGSAKPGGSTNGAPPKVNLSKGSKGKAGQAPKNGSGGAASRRKASGPGATGKAAGGPPGGSGAGKPKGAPGPFDEDFDTWVFLQAAKARLNDWWNDKYGRKEKHAWDYDSDEDDQRDPPVPAESLGFTVDRPDRPAPGEQPPRRPQAGPPSVTTGVRGLPPAPEPHTPRPGTTRPTGKESSVSNTEVTTPSGQGGLATQHRTDITFGEFLTDMVNIAIQAGIDQERAESLAQALGKVADALRDMATDLAGDHNIAPEVTTLITDLADAAGRMKQQAERCAAECGVAFEAAKLSAAMVAKVYGEDMNAVNDAGLAYASSATHHD